jgi:hypothetical protein
MSDDFFVGYLPTPPSLRRMLLGIVVALLLVAAAVAATIAFAQRDPGAGVWKDSQLDTLQGTLLTEPYPLLYTTDSKIVLLVGVGKHGVAERLAKFTGHTVKLQGHLLQRNGWTMLEIEDASDSVQSLGAARADIPLMTDISAAQTFRGEIIDPKCYLGAMKPGDGKAHKACATLCIRGGIPPAFVVTEGSSPVYYLLVTDSIQSILPYVGDPVQLHGTTAVLGDLHLLRVNPDSIRRL